MNFNKILISSFLIILLLSLFSAINNQYKNLKRTSVNYSKVLANELDKGNKKNFDSKTYEIKIYDNFTSAFDAQKFIDKDNEAEPKVLGFKKVYSFHKISTSDKNNIKVIKVKFNTIPILLDSLKIKNIFQFFVNTFIFCFLIYFISSKFNSTKNRKLVLESDTFFYKFTYISLGYGFLYLLISYFGFHYYNLEQFANYLMHPGMRFLDWVNDTGVISNNSPYLNSGGSHLNSYPPFAYFQVSIINYITFGIREIIYILFALIFYVLIFLTNIKDKLKLNKINILFAILLTSYPFLFTLDRGNITILAFFWLFLAYCYNKKSTLTECIFISLAGATKIYPSIILFKYLFQPNKRRYFFIGSTIICTISLLIISTYEGEFLSNIIKYKELLSERSSNVYFASGQPLYFTLDIWSFIQIIISSTISIFSLNIESIRYIFGYEVLKVFNIIIFSMFLYMAYKIEKNGYTDIKKITFYLISVIFIMPYSFDYHLMYILISIFLIILNNNFSEKRILFFLILLTLPKRFLIIPIGHMGIGAVELGCIINPILILILYYEIFKHNHQES